MLEKKVPTLPTAPDRVLKEDDFKFFIECVEDGLWQNNTYMAELCSVSRETIGIWKRTPQAIEARKRASKDLRRALKGKGDIEKRMKEAGMDVSPTVTEVHHVIQILGGKSNVSTDNSDTEITKS